MADPDQNHDYACSDVISI